MKNKTEPDTVNYIQVKPILSESNLNTEKNKEPQHGCRDYMKAWSESTTLHGVKYCFGTGSIFRRFGSEMYISYVQTVKHFCFNVISITLQTRGRTCFCCFLSLKWYYARFFISNVRLKLLYISEDCHR